MRDLICYNGGGICNRLQPLATCMAIAQKHKRRLLVYWEDAEYCQAHLKDLFQTPFDFITLDDLQEMGYPASWAPTALGLKPIHRRISEATKWDISDLDKDKRVLIFGSRFGEYLRPEAEEMIRSLVPAQDIQDTINKYIKDFKN